MFCYLAKILIPHGEKLTSLLGHWDNELINVKCLLSIWFYGVRFASSLFYSEIKTLKRKKHKIFGGVFINFIFSGVFVLIFADCKEFPTTKGWYKIIDRHYWCNFGVTEWSCFLWCPTLWGILSSKNCFNLGLNHSCSFKNASCPNSDETT